LVAMDPEVRRQTEISIVTHATKILPELGRTNVLRYPGAPGTELLRKVVSNLRENLCIKKINIVFDHKIDCNVSCEYLENLRSFSAQECLRLLISPSASGIPSQITATTAFNLAVECVSSNYLVLWEHDHLFQQKIDWDLIQAAFDSGAKMVRFNRRINKTVVDLVPECVTDSSISQKLCRTDYYCNGPFVAEKLWVRDLFRLATRNPPLFSAPFGAFVEGPVNQIMMRDRFNMPEQDFYRVYPIYLYGGLGALPVVSHFGDFPGRRARWTKRFKQLLGLADPAG